MFLAFFSGLLVLICSGWRADSFKSYAFLLGMVSMFVIGLVDDLKSLSAGMKLIFQVGIALVMVLAGHRIDLGWVDSFVGLSVSGIITIFWIVGVTNSLNMIDGMDGLAAGISFLVLISMSVMSMATRSESGLSVFAIPLAGVCLGFLRYNFFPAKVFMGDGGSLLLGFALAMLSLAQAESVGDSGLLLNCIVVLGVPVFDFGFSVMRRALMGENIFKADKDHLHHRIHAAGCSHRRTVIILYGITLFFCAVSLGGLYYGVNSSMVVALIYLAAVMVMGLKLGWIRQIVIFQRLRLRKRWRVNVGSVEGAE